MISFQQYLDEERGMSMSHMIEHSSNDEILKLVQSFNYFLAENVKRRCISADVSAKDAKNLWSEFSILTNRAENDVYELINIRNKNYGLNSILEQIIMRGGNDFI